MRESGGRPIDDGEKNRQAIMEPYPSRRGAGRAEVRARKVHRRRDGAERGGSLPLLSGRELNKKFCERVETFT